MFALAMWSNCLGWPLLAVTLVFWARLHALRAPAPDPSHAWFTFLRRARAIATTCMTLSLAVGTFGVLSRSWWPPMGAGSASFHATLTWLWLFAPLFAIQVAVPLLAHGVARRLATSELTWGEVRRQVTWSTVTFASMTLGFLEAIGALWGFQWTAFALWLVGGLAVGAWSALRFRRAMGFSPQAITHGELRDRVFALAAGAGVKLTQIYVLPMKRMRMGNAFALQNQIVMVTDFLLEHLNRDEVDAVLAHEIGHLRHRHPEQLRLSRAAALLLPMAGIFLGGWIAVGALMLVGAFGAAALSRHFERIADREVVRLGASGEALITGLVKLAKIGFVPLRWDRRTGWLLTHPSVEQRAKSMVRALGLPPERVAELLASPAPPTDRYDVPAATADEGTVFSTAFKHGTQIRNSVASLIAAVMVPALIAALSPAFGPAARGGMWLVALVVTPLACIVLFDRLAVSSLRALRPRLERRLGSPGRAHEPVLTALAPHADPRVYEGFANWDLGLLWIEGECLHYRGEQTAFTLRPHQVESLELAPGAPSWIRTQLVRLHWRDPAGVVRPLRLTPLEAPTLSGVAAHSRRLFERLERWKSAAAAAPIEAERRDLELPPAVEVTALSPRRLVTPAFYLRMLPIGFLASAVACGLIGAPIDPMRGMGILEVFVTFWLTQALLTVPLLRYREPIASGAPAAERERRAA